jgi:hypothetical protein
MRPSVDKDGYLRVKINNDCGKSIHTGVHRLVALTYLVNPLSKPEVNHIDEDKTNNALSNLQWVTRKENENSKSNRARGERLKNNKLSSKQVLAIRELFELGIKTRKELTSEYPVTLGTINRILNRSLWNHI